MSQDRKFHVIIIGGSIAGLTLAHALSTANIDYTLLEAKDDPFADHKTGAGLTLLPNGARILHQLGVYHEVVKHTQPVYWHTTWFEDGRLLRRVNTRDLCSRRTGYPLAVISRQELLGSLFNHLCDKERVLFSKRVIQVIAGSSRVTIHCQDGSSISGDIVVGADGIHSVTRRQMLQYIYKQKDGLQIPSISFSTAYSGLFGTSSPTPGLQPGDAHRTYGHGWSMIVTIGHDETVYWYVAIKADGARIPRNQTDAYIGTIAAPFLQENVTEHVRFADIFQNTTASRHVPLEESLEWQWSWGRIACIGDAVHKMTPNIAQGANCAIETAATLANHIISIAHKPGQPRKDILGKWYSSHWWRMKLFYTSSQTLIRVEASTTFIARILGLYIGFFHGELVMGMLSDISWFTARLNHLPLPQVREDEEKDRKDTSWSDMCCSTICMVLPLGIIAAGVYVMNSAIKG